MMNKKIDVNKFRADLYTTKRKEFLKYLIDAGLDIDSSGETIRSYYKRGCLFVISDFARYQVKITENFKNLEGINVDTSDLYEEIMNYASLEIEDRFKDIEIIRSAE